MKRLEDILFDDVSRHRVQTAWERISAAFESAARDLATPWMTRSELSFHEQVRLLGFACLAVELVPGDIVEIGVWKGKSLTFMREVAGGTCKIVGVDPCAQPGQSEEIDYYRRALFADATIVKAPSEHAIAEVAAVARRVKLLHIDGGHTAANVWMDFLLYDHLVVSGGYVVFDDYGDLLHSPDVANAVDSLNALGFFARYDVIGQLSGFENSFVLRMR